MTELEPLPPGLRELFASERDVSAVEREAIRKKLEASVGAAPAVPPITAHSATKVLVGAGVLGVIAAIWVVTRREPAALPPPPPPPVVESAVSQPRDIASAHEAPAAPALVEPPPSAAQPAAPTQADLLARAWQALGRDDAATTLSLLAQDRRLHRDGPLAEEREAMEVRALAAAGRIDDARAAAKRFIARWPSSVHRAAIDKAVAP